MSHAVIIPAGGSGSRFSSTTPKLRRLIHQKPVITWAIEPFIHHPSIHQIVVACPPNQREAYELLLSPLSPIIQLVDGGQSRPESVYRAFQYIDKTSKGVLIHDAARPHIQPALINRVIQALTNYPVVIPAVSVTDTIKQVCDNTIERTLDRDHLVAVQTPQGFHYHVLKQAYESILTQSSGRAALSTFTDEAGLVESIGIYGHVVTGDTANIKLTHPSDEAYIHALKSQDQHSNH